MTSEHDTDTAGDEVRYARLRPDQVRDRMAACPVAFVPWGALEWHSFHLPVGLDGLVAETFAERAARRIGGLVLPTMYLPITALPLDCSISIQATTVRAVLDDLLAELARVGFRVVVILSGHFAPGHELVLMDAAQDAYTRHNLPVIASPPLALARDDFLDHAGHWETSTLLALHPELVALEKLDAALDREPAMPRSRLGILGRVPLTTASAEVGNDVIGQALDALERMVIPLLTTADPAPLQTFYAQRRAAYQPYIEQYYRGSWEDAAAQWWSEVP